jgi:tartrate/fumarate subfamily iron-sulfur-dependent hydro-lyase beta chain
MTKKHVLRTPLASSDVMALKVGDVVYLDGRIFTARDQAHMLMLKQGIPKGLETKGLAVYHCGPIVKENENGQYITSAGPTTSMRMESLEPEFLRLSGTLAVIGKGGMGPSTLEALKKYGAVYLSITGGVGALAMKQLGPIKAVHFLEELGPVEAVWEFDARELGPLVVTMDAHGNSLHKTVSAETLINLEKVLMRMK